MNSHCGQEDAVLRYYLYDEPPAITIKDNLSKIMPFLKQTALRPPIMASYYINPAWISKGELGGAWIRMDFPQPVTINRIVLEDRPQIVDNILDSSLDFSYGTSIDTGALPKTGNPPDSGQVEVIFEDKIVSWVRFNVVQGEGNAVGLNTFKAFYNGQDLSWLAQATSSSQDSYPMGGPAEYATIGNILDISEYYLGPEEFFIYIYPFWGADHAYGLAPYSGPAYQPWLDTHLYYSLEKVRDAGLRHGKDFWIIVQAFSLKNAGGEIWRSPSPEEIRLQVYSAMAYGTKGVWYFMYSSFVNPVTGDNITGIVDYVDSGYQHGTEPFLSRYGEVQAINQELEILGPLMVNLTSTHVYNWSQPQGNVASVAGQDVQLGEFIGQNGDGYLMIVNRDTQSSNAVSVDYLSGDTEGSQVVVTNMLANQAEILTISGGKITIIRSLAPGDGILLRIG